MHYFMLKQICAFLSTVDKNRLASVNHSYHEQICRNLTINNVYIKPNLGTYALLVKVNRWTYDLHSYASSYRQIYVHNINTIRISQVDLIKTIIFIPTFHTDNPTAILQIADETTKQRYIFRELDEAKNQTKILILTLAEHQFLSAKQDNAILFSVPVCGFLLFHSIILELSKMKEYAQSSETSYYCREYNSKYLDEQLKTRSADLQIFDLCELSGITFSTISTKLAWHPDYEYRIWFDCHLYLNISKNFTRSVQMGWIGSMINNKCQVDVGIICFNRFDNIKVERFNNKWETIWESNKIPIPNSRWTLQSLS